MRLQEFWGEKLLNILLLDFIYSLKQESYTYLKVEHYGSIKLL